MNNIKMIIDNNLKSYGILKSIPLLRNGLGIKNFTFMAKYIYFASNQSNPIFFIEDYDVNYILINSPGITSQLNNIDHICQIITQKQEKKSRIDITKNILKFCKVNPNFTFYLVTNTQDFKLKSNSYYSRGDRSIIDNFNINSIEIYDSILDNYLRENYLKNLRKYYHFTKNLYFLKAAQNYEDIYVKLKRFEDLFDFRHLREHKINNHRYILLKFLNLILKEINKSRGLEGFQLDAFLDKILKPVIDHDKLRIKNHIDEYFQSIKYNRDNLKEDFGGLICEA